MSSWTKMEKTDNKITISFKKESGKPEVEMISCEIKDISGSEESDETESSKSRNAAKRRSSILSIRKFTRKPRMRNVDEEKMDEDVDKIIKNISHVNKAIRCKYNLPYKMTSCSMPLAVDRRVSEHSSDTEVSSSQKSSGKNKKKSKVPVDHLGVPLSHPMAVTPFPGASSAAQREKARRMLRSLAQLKVNKGEEEGGDESKKRGRKKKKDESHSDVSSHENRKLRMVRSTTFPSKCTAEMRAKARKHIHKMAKRNAGEDTPDSDDELVRSKTANASSNTDVSNSSELSSSAESSDANKNSQTKWTGQFCPNCGTCTTCANKCDNDHVSLKITDNDRKKFMDGIYQLRKRIQKPEHDRRCTSKSPFDLTQSLSENTMTSSKGRRKSKMQKV